MEFLEEHASSIEEAKSLQKLWRADFLFPFLQGQRQVRLEHLGKG